MGDLGEAAHPRQQQAKSGGSVNASYGGDKAQNMGVINPLIRVNKADMRCGVYRKTLRGSTSGKGAKQMRLSEQRAARGTDLTPKVGTFSGNKVTNEWFDARARLLKGNTADTVLTKLCKNM